jgi:tetratricopeptide (TPR) repeat protein
MPKLRATSLCLRRAGLPGASIAAAVVLLALTGSAHSQALKNNVLQPHGVATSLHNLRDEMLQPAPSAGASSQGIAPRYDVLAPDFRRRTGAYRLQGDVNAAIADFDRAIRIEPKKIDSLLRRGLAYLEMGNSDLAIRDFTEVLNLSPRHAVAVQSRRSRISPQAISNVRFPITGC